MKRRTVFLVFFMVLFLLSGCDYYSDAYISVTLPQPDGIGVKEYQAGVSAKKNATRIFQLSYALDGITDGQIKIALPEKLKDETGAEYPIDSFGGPAGTNAPSQKFKLILRVQEGTSPETSVALTIDVGALPLDTRDWDDIEIQFATDDSVTQVPLESVIFLSDEPLSYKVYLKEEAPNGSVSDAANSEKWYELPKAEYLAGERVVIRVKHPEDGVERSLAVTHEPVELVEVRDEYTQYEFIMPYHSVRITIVDEKN